MGHATLATTQVYLHVARLNGLGVTSPLDRLAAPAASRGTVRETAVGYAPSVSATACSTRSTPASSSAGVMHRLGRKRMLRVPQPSTTAPRS